MTQQNENLEFAKRIQEAAKQVDDAKQQIATAQTEVDSAREAAGNATPENQTLAYERLNTATAQLRRAEDGLQKANQNLESLLPTKPQASRTSVCWYLASGILALALFFFAAAYFDHWLRHSEGEVSLSHKLINVWLGLTATVIGAVMLFAAYVLDQRAKVGRLMKGQEPSPPGTDVLSTVPVSKIREAAQRVEESKQKERVAQIAVDSAQAVVDDPGTTEKDAADAKLKSAKADLASSKEFLRFEQQQLNNLMRFQSQATSTNFSTFYLGYFVFGMLALVVLVFLMYGIIHGALLPELANTSVSRGLITFLVAVVTVTIALILILSSIVSDSPDRARRFMQGKEVLTMLIGVLGTIVGFYFGNSTESVKSLEIATPVISNENPELGGKIDVVSFVSGGKAPYAVDIDFIPPQKDPVKQIRSEDGTVRLQGLLVNQANEDGTVSYKITAHDAEGRTGLYDSSTHAKDLRVKPKK